MSNLSDFVIDGILLTKYTGPGGDLVIPEGVKAISDYAGIFPENVEFTSVSLPNSLERSTWGMWLWPLHIKTEAFVVSPEHPQLACIDGVLYTKDLTELVACPSLKKGELALPKTLCQIAPGALDQAHGLTSFRVDPEHSTLCSLDGLIYTKDKEKLIGCPAGKVGTITVAAETNAIAEVALNGCPYVTEYAVPPENQKYSSIDGVLYNKSGSRLLKYPAGRKGEFIVPDHVIGISKCAFDSAACLF